jgi:ankyrin repeat protein
VVRLLIEAGADPNVAVSGMWHAETPLHWAASTDDVDVAAALIDAGADLEAQGGSIGGPLENAVGYRCWHVARLLVDPRAPVDTLRVAAALGLEPWIEDRFAQRPPPTSEETDAAFWQAYHGGQRRVAELLLLRGADANVSPDYSDKSALEIAGSLDTRRGFLVTWLREQGTQAPGKTA